MFDTMTLTKAVGSLCGALLIFLMGKWAGELLYHTGGGHGDDHAQGYVIDTGSDDSAGGGDAEGPSLAELWAVADVDKGAKVFGKCKACHKLEDGANATGPFLYGVVGRDVDAAAGFGYSGSLGAVTAVWTPETLDAFLENPKGYAPGTTMGFSGLKKPEDRANVIAFLDQLDGDTFQMEAPAAEMAPAEEAAPAEAEAAPEEEAAAEGQAAAEETAMAEPAAEEPAAEEPAAEEPAAAGGSDFAALVASADQEKGAKVYNKCKACHKLEDGKNGLGPHLAGIVGRAVGGVEGFKYSDAMKSVGGDWTIDQLNAWLENPKEFAPGNRMSFAGLRKEEDRAALIAYLQAN